MRRGRGFHLQRVRVSLPVPLEQPLDVGALGRERHLTLREAAPGDVGRRLRRGKLHLRSRRRVTRQSCGKGLWQGSGARGAVRRGGGKGVVQGGRTNSKRAKRLSSSQKCNAS